MSKDLGLPSSFMEMLSASSNDLKLKMHEALISTTSVELKKIMFNTLKEQIPNCQTPIEHDNLQPSPEPDYPHPSTLDNEAPIPPPAQLVKYIPEFVSDSDTIKDILSEIEKLDLASTEGVSSQWLSCSSNPYIYPDRSTVHKAKDISQYPKIWSLMEKMNGHEYIDRLLFDFKILLSIGNPMEPLR